MKRSMRWVISGVALLGFAQSAFSADLDYLRGSEVFAPAPATYFRWSGFYVGGDVGFSSADFQFGSRPLMLLSGALITTPLPNATTLASTVPPLSPDNASATSFGAFAGYNTQWEDAVLGMEVNYHRISLDGAASSSTHFGIAAPGPGQTAFNVDLSMSSRVHLTDYGTIRGRAGWAFGCFLPYATVGLAIGRADITNSATVHFVAINGTGAVVSDVNLTPTENKKDQLAYGFAVGLGTDVMLMSSLFLRAEYEFVDFTKFGDRRLSMNTVRAGLGYRF